MAEEPQASSAAALSSLTIDAFLRALASNAPTPGGGSVAGLAGALAAALGRMACGLTIGRRSFAAVESQVRELAERFDRARHMLCDLMDEDARAYAAVSAAWKLPKDAPGRADALEKAANLAAAVPLETMAVARSVLLDLRLLAEIGNPNLRSDVEAGMHLARAAVRCAARMVEVNLPLIGEDQRTILAGELQRLREIGAD